MSQVTLSFPGKEQSFHLAHSQTTSRFIELSTKETLTLHTLMAQNTFLRADNLVVLKTIESIGGSVDIIYIDPPYNTETKFTYNDVHESQSHWLSMMTSRLILAKNILAEDGLFFISIDDREMATLTLLLQEIFGKENHIGTIKWRKKRKPSFLDKHFSSVIEYVLIFTKNINKCAKLKGQLTEEKTRPVLNASNSIVTRVLQKGTRAYCKDGTYKIGQYKNRTLSFELLDNLVIQGGELQQDIRVRGKFRVNQEILNKTVFVTKNFGLRRIVLESEQTFKHATDDATVHFETNEDAEAQLKSLFSGEKVFEFPKPVGLIKNLLSMYSSKKEKILCLDFFAGTATLAQAVHELNSQISKNKFLFCCVQSEEPTNNSKFKTVADIALARIIAVEEKYKIFPKCKIFSPSSKS